MARPTGLHATVEDYYDRLPGFYREFDAQQTNADGSEEEYYPLLRFISGVGNELGKIYDLVTRFDFENNGTTSDLVDPVTADDAFIPWLAVLAGVRNAGTETIADTASWEEIVAGVDDDGSGTADWDEFYDIDTTAPTSVLWQEIQDLNIESRASYLGTRAQISRRITFGYDEGTAGSIERAVKSVLQGTDPYCVAGSHAEILAAGVAGSFTVYSDFAKTTALGSAPADAPWRIYILVDTTETPGSNLASIIDGLLEYVKPAGFFTTLVYK